MILAGGRSSSGPGGAESHWAGLVHEILRPLQDLCTEIQRIVFPAVPPRYFPHCLAPLSGTNCAAQTMLLRSWHCPIWPWTEELSLQGRREIPNASVLCFLLKSLRACTIGNGGNPGGRRLSASGFLVLVFIHRCQAARPQLPPPAASSQLRQPWTPSNHNCTLCWAQFVPASVRSAERMWTGHFVAVDSSMAVYGWGDRNSVFPLDSFLRPVWPFPAKLSSYRYVRYVLLFISILSCFLARDAFFFVFADACKRLRCFCLPAHAVWTPEGMNTLFPMFENSLLKKHCELFVFCVKQWLQSASTEARLVGALCV